MSEEFKSLRDLAKDRQPRTPGLYAAEMLRRCKLRDVPVYIDLTLGKEAQILGPDVEHVVYYLQEGKPNSEWKERGYPEPNTEEWTQRGFQEPSEAHVYLEVPDAGERISGITFKLSKLCRVDLGSLEALITFYSERKNDFRSFKDWEQDIFLRVIGPYFIDEPLFLAAQPDVNSQIFLPSQGFWDLNDSDWTIHLCFEVLQHKGWVEDLGKDKEQRWQWKVAMDYGIAFVNWLIENRIIDKRPKVLKTFLNEKGKPFSMKKTSPTDTSSSPQEIAELLDPLLPTFFN